MERVRRTRRRRHRVEGGILALVGFVLSPLSWWNDLLVNAPLAYAFATLVGFFARDLFVPALVVGYWVTNVVGLVLLHVGGRVAISEEPRAYTRRSLGRDLLISVGYTLLIVLLVVSGVLRFPTGLLP